MSVTNQKPIQFIIYFAQSIHCSTAVDYVTLHLATLNRATVKRRRVHWASINRSDT